MPTSSLAGRPVARLRAVLAAALAVALLVLAAAPSAAGPPPHAKHERTVTVLSRNLYLGATLAPLFPTPPLGSPQEVVAAATQLWHQVQATQFPVRAVHLAAEIAEAKPDLVGLQEVTLYRVGTAGDPAPATEVRLDFLAVLQKELRARGLRYDVAVSQDAFDGELTAFDWAPPAGSGGLVDIRLTDRDVILVRRGPKTANLKVSNPQGGIFRSALSLPVLGQPLPIARGWTSVDVKHRGREFRFVNTHLEAFDQRIALRQAHELLAIGPAATRMPVVLVGDFNSAPGEAAYRAITAAGFADVAVGGPPTCCYDASLANPAATLETRIDLVFHRGPIRARSVERIGAEPVRSTPPLWASDHAGILAELVLK